MSSERTRTDRILESYGYDQSNLIAILQEIQAEYKYLSEESLTLVAEKLGISAAKVYSVATFYENFSLEAKGKHIIKVCAGTACHVRTRFTIIWACPGRKRPPRTGCSPWKPWRASAPAVWPPS